MQTEVKKPTTLPKLNLPWVDSPFFETLLNQCTLDETTKKQVKHFADYGYLIIDPEIEDFERLSEQIIHELEPHYKGLGRIQDGWTINDAVKKLAIAPKILSILRILYQREPIPFQTLNFPKGTEQSTHSDTIHFHCVPARFMCGVWVALEDIDAYNGPLHYYPGSHKLPIFNLNHLGLSGSYQSFPYEYYSLYEDLVQGLISNGGFKKVDISVKKGQALIWAANLFHGGSPILDPNRSRHSQVTHYYFSDCIYYTPLLSDPFLKRIYMKKITNIITGEVVPHFYNDRLVVGDDEDGIINLNSTENEIDKLRFSLYKIKGELENAQNFINWVENSKFWKLRNQWFKLKKILGLVK